MVHPLKGRTFRLVGLVATLTIVAGIELAAGPFFVPRPPRVSPTLDDLKNVQPISPAEKPDISVFSEITERPLFSRSRRPPSPSEEPAADKPSPKAENYDLVGVLVSPDERVALLRRHNSQEIIRAVEGQQVGGWEVQAIKPTEVVLRRGDFSEPLKINDTRRKTAAPKPRNSKKRVKENDVKSAEPVTAEE